MPERGGKRANGRLMMGLITAGLGRKAGFAQFGGTPEAFLATLAPSLGFLIVACGSLVWSGFRLLGLTVFLVFLCNLLAPPVIAEALSRLWRRRAQWARFANVLNCMPWLVLALLTLLMPVAGAAVSAGMPSTLAGTAVVAAAALYGMWFNWFAARHVLELSAGRALVVMLAVMIGTLVLLQIPVTICNLAGITPSMERLQQALEASTQHGSDQPP